MNKYKQRSPVVVEAMTFDEFVASGRQLAKTLHNGVPWSWDFCGRHITHENDDCYIVGHEELFKRGDMLVMGPTTFQIYDGELFRRKFEPLLQAVA